MQFIYNFNNALDNCRKGKYTYKTMKGGKVRATGKHGNAGTETGTETGTGRDAQNGSRYF